jgi:hypothetical protein
MGGDGILYVITAWEYSRALHMATSLAKDSLIHVNCSGCLLQEMSGQRNAINLIECQLRLEPDITDSKKYLHIQYSTDVLCNSMRCTYILILLVDLIIFNKLFAQFYRQDIHSFPEPEFVNV